MQVLLRVKVLQHVDARQGSSKLPLHPPLHHFPVIVKAKASAHVGST